MDDSNPLPLNREGSLKAPMRHPIDWQREEFYDQKALDEELERVFDICHGCRRCVNLCESFPTLFDLVDQSETMEIDGVAKKDYQKVVDQCYQCDLCFMTKCPYVPPHEWNVDFPHLMLRAKAVRFKKEGARFRDKVLTSTDKLAKGVSIPLIDVTVNWLNNQKPFRKVLESTLGIHHQAVVPKYYHRTLRKRFKKTLKQMNIASGWRKVLFFSTCYGNYNAPTLGEDFLKVFQHNKIRLDIMEGEVCCGMPKFDLGDLEAVKRLKEINIPKLEKYVDDGYAIVAPIPSCVLMFKQELPALFPDDAGVQKVKAAFYDPFEYLYLLHKEGKFKTSFKNCLGNVSYHVPCHQRVQNIGLKTRDILSLIPNTFIHIQERCSGHDGTYAVRKESHENAVKIARPVVRKIDQLHPEVFTSDCPMAANHLVSLSETMQKTEHPMTLLRWAYGL